MCKKTEVDKPISFFKTERMEEFPFLLYSSFIYTNDALTLLLA